MGKDKREETSPRQAQKVGEKDTHKRREEEREGAWACACHTALFFFFFFSSAAVCLSVWGFLCPLKTSSLLSCLFKKVFVSLTICNSPPQTQKRKKKKISCFKSFVHSLKFCSGWIESRGLGVWKSFSEGFVRVVFEDLLRLTFSILCGIIPTEREREREREREGSGDFRDGHNQISSGSSRICGGYGE
jgi:hypothetical protein